jgi:hypothetical protein
MMPVLAASSPSDPSVWSDLLSVVLYGLGAGVGLAIVFSIAIRGLVTASTARRAGNASAALLWGGVGVAGVVVCLAAVVVGLLTMLHR